MTDTTLTIEQVQAQFADWRRDKEGRPRIPDDLWDEVVKLLKIYPRGRVLRLLSISTQQAAKKGVTHAQTNPIKPRASKSTVFAKVPVAESMLKIANAELILTSKCGDHQVSMKNPTTEHIKLILDRFLR